MSVLLSVVCCVLIAPANPVTAFPRPATSIGSRDYVTGAPVAAKIAYEYVNCPLQAVVVCTGQCAFYTHTTVQLLPSPATVPVAGR